MDKTFPAGVTASPKNCARCGTDTSQVYKRILPGTPWFGTELAIESFLVRATFHVRRKDDQTVIVCPRCCHDLINTALPELRAETLTTARQLSLDYDEA